MKKSLLLIFILMAAVFASEVELPRKTSRAVNDFAGILNPGFESEAERYLRTLYEQSGYSLVAAIVDSLGGMSVEEYSARLFRKWGIGDKDTDMGLLILLSSGERKARIEVGYGAEALINDAKAGRVLRDHMIPYLKNNDYEQALASGIKALSMIITDGKGLSAAVSGRDPRGGRYGHSQYGKQAEISPLGLLILIIILGFMLATPFGRSLLFFMVLSSLMGGRRGGRSGFGGGFGGGGSFGGFGGGMSGGGGASADF